MAIQLLISTSEGLYILKNERALSALATLLADLGTWKYMLILVYGRQTARRKVEKMIGKGRFVKINWASNLAEVRCTWFNDESNRLFNISTLQVS